MDLINQIKTRLAEAKQNKSRGQFAFLQGAGMGIVTLVILLGIGAYVLTSINSTIGANQTTAATIIGYGLTALSTFGNWLGIVVVVVVAAVVLWLVGGFGRGGGRGM